MGVFDILEMVWAMCVSAGGLFVCACLGLSCRRVVKSSIPPIDPVLGRVEKNGRGAHKGG